MDEAIKLMLQQAISAAKDGDVDTALDLVKDVLDSDEENVQAWLLLARLSSNIDEKRVALSNVIALDPDNERAQKMFAKLEEQVTQSPDQVEIIPGVTRRMALILGGGGLALIVVIVLVISALSGSEQAELREAEEEAAAAIMTQDRLNADQTEVAAAATQEEDDRQATATAIYFATNPPPTDTPSGPTLPPTATPTTPPTPTPTPLPPPADLTGTITGWSGRGPEGSDLDLVFIPLDASDLIPIAGLGGREPRLISTTQQVIYVNYNRDTFTDEVDIVDFEGVDQNFTVNVPTSVSNLTISPDGTQIAFVAEELISDNFALYIVELSSANLAESVRRLTTDDASYSYPSFSPDGSSIAVVRDNTASETAENPGVDLVRVDLTTGTLSPLTDDRNTIIESMPRWMTDASGGTLLFYAAIDTTRVIEDPAVDPENHDIYMMNPANPGSGLARIATNADEMFPVPSPDGRFLAYASDQTGAYEVHIVDLTSGETYQMSDNGDDTFPGDWR